MIVIFSGEGQSDIGKAAHGQKGLCAPGQWEPGPAAWLADQIFARELNYSLLESSAYFISEAAIGDLSKKMSPLRFRRIGEDAYHCKYALILSIVALALGKKYEQPVAAVLFRDCDGSQSSPSSRWKILLNSISGIDTGGFYLTGFKTGVAMVPNPKAEAWYLCALKENPYERCDMLENESGNDRATNPLKSQLSHRLIELGYPQIYSLVKPDKNNRCLIDANKINMRSFNKFKEEFTLAIRKNSANWYNKNDCVVSRMSLNLRIASELINLF